METTDSTAHSEINWISESHGQFSKDLYKVISEASDGNIFFSPFSISVALAMTHMGSRGMTEEQLRTSLHLPDDIGSIKKSYNALLQDVGSPSSEYELRTSNRAYVANSLSVLEDYSSTLMQHYFTQLHNVDFSEESKTRKIINENVEKDTNQKIKDLIAPGVLDDSTKMVLVNAIYFKGLWEHQFKVKATIDQPFWISATESIQTPLMSIEGKKFRVENIPVIKARRLSMDYKGDRLSFVIVLPNARDGLKEIEQNLSSFKFTDVNAHQQEIAVRIPKFKMEEMTDLGPLLVKLGITDLFSSQTCNLSGVTEEIPGLFVSKVVHKAFLEVSEEGCEAAAATAVIMMTQCMRFPEEPFIIDHPFLFYIFDKKAKLPLFVGKMTNP